MISDTGVIHRPMEGLGIGIVSSNTGGSCLSQIFWEHENLSSLLVIKLIYIKLYRKKETKFWEKKSGLSGNLASPLYGLSGTHL